MGWLLRALRSGGHRPSDVCLSHCCENKCPQLFLCLRRPPLSKTEFNVLGPRPWSHPGKPTATHSLVLEIGKCQKAGAAGPRGGRIPQEKSWSRVPSGWASFYFFFPSRSCLLKLTEGEEGIACPLTAYGDDPGRCQKASGFQSPTQASWTSGTSGPQETAPAATKTQEPRSPACLDFPKYFGPRA